MESLGSKRRETQRFQHLHAKITFSLALRQAKRAVTGSQVLLRSQAVSGSLCVPQAGDCALVRSLRCGVQSSAQTCTNGIQPMFGLLP